MLRLTSLAVLLPLLPKAKVGKAHIMSVKGWWEVSIAMEYIVTSLLVMHVLEEAAMTIAKEENDVYTSDDVKSLIGLQSSA